MKKLKFAKKKTHRASTGAASKLTQLQPGKKILAVEISGPFIMAAVAEKRGRKLNVKNFVSIERTTSGDDLPDSENIKELMERLKYPGGPAVLITPMARSVQIDMSRAKADSLRHYQLCDVLRWEVEPYTGITGVNALIGAEKGSPAEQEDILLLHEDEAETEVNVSVIEQNVYRAMKQIFKRSGLKLMRLYPPEVCFFVPLFQEKVETIQAVFDIGTDYANFTLVKGSKPKQINTFPLGKDVLLDLIENDEQDDAAQSLEFLLRQVPGPLPLLLTGTGGAQQKIVDFLDRESPYGAKPLPLKRADNLGRSGLETQNTMYCSTVGAALRELMGKKWRQIGISDAIPIPVRAKESVYLIPVGFAVILILGLCGHYQYMKINKARYTKQTKELQQNIEKIQKKFDAYAQLEAKRNNLKETSRRYTRQLEFLHHGADDNLEHINRVLNAFFSLPPEMQLESLEQLRGENRYQLSGISTDFKAVGDYAVALQRFPWCLAVNIKELERTGKENSLTFRIIMETSPEMAENMVKPETELADSSTSAKVKK